MATRKRAADGLKVVRRWDGWLVCDRNMNYGTYAKKSDANAELKKRRAAFKAMRSNPAGWISAKAVRVVRNKAGKVTEIKIRK